MAIEFMAFDGPDFGDELRHECRAAGFTEPVAWPLYLRFEIFQTERHGSVLEHGAHFLKLLRGVLFVDESQIVDLQITTGETNGDRGFVSVSVFD